MSARWKIRWISGSSTAPSASAATSSCITLWLAIARHEDSRMCLILLGAILENPGLAERLLQVFKTQRKGVAAMTLD